MARMCPTPLPSPPEVVPGMRHGPSHFKCVQARLSDVREPVLDPQKLVRSCPGGQCGKTGDVYFFRRNRECKGALGQRDGRSHAGSQRSARTPGMKGGRLESTLSGRSRGRGLGRLNWAETATTRVASGRTGVPAKAAIPLQARSRLRRRSGPWSSIPQREEWSASALPARTVRTPERQPASPVLGTPVKVGIRLG
jgi:hypothetical protein